MKFINYMSNFLNIYNELTNFNNIYEQELMNSVIEMSMNQPKKYRKIISKKGEKDLKQVKYNSNDFSMKECPITLKEFKEGDIVTQLPCKHIFDSSGILTWLKEEKASCPICRYELDAIEVENELETINDVSNQLFQTNPLSLFSNITIDLSLHNDLLQPYNRDYNIPLFGPLTLGDEEEDDLFFYNSLQLFEDSENSLSDFRTIIQQFDLCGNIIQ